MTDATLTFLILGATIALFVSDRLRLDVVSLLSLLAIVLLGLVSPEQALAGFGNPVVVMIAGLFVVGGALSSTGVADWLGQRLGRLAGAGEARLIVVVMLASATLSAFMSSTGTVAILLPVVGTLAQRRRLAPGRVLMPLALGSLLGGMLTLIGTPPNLVVSGALRDAGHTPFSFFSFSAPGLVMLALGIGFMLVAGKRLLPSGDASSGPNSIRSLAVGDLAQEYGLQPALHALRVKPGARLEGVTLAEANLRAELGVTVVSIAAGGRGGPARRVLPQTRFEADDALVVQGSAAEVATAAERWGLQQLADPRCLELPAEESLAEIVLPRRSALVGRTLGQARFRDRHRATVLGVRRAAATERVTGSALKAYRLGAGDTLLLKGRVHHLRNLREEHRDFVLLTEPDVGVTYVDRPRAIAAVAITLGMLVVMTFGWLPNVIAVLCAAVLMVLTGSLRAQLAYRTINWESVVLIACMLPLATALDESGGMQLVVDGLTRALGGAGPRVVMIALFVLTSVFSQVISNTATTVLVAPVAVSLSAALGVAPHPLLMAVAIAASTAFSTPIASPVNTLIMGPGGYRFMDFFRVGVPLQVLVLAATVLVVPLVFPF